MIPEGYYVYAYYEPGRAEPFYIGKGRNRRAWRHLEPCSLNINDPFHRKLKQMKRDGFEPIIEILLDNLTESEAHRYEIQLIARYGRQDQFIGCLLNLTDGGEGQTGFKHSEKSRQKISLVKTGSIYLTKRRPIIQLHHDRIIRRYDFIDQVIEYGLNAKVVGNCLISLSQKAHGYKWKYADDLLIKDLAESR